MTGRPRLDTLSAEVLDSILEQLRPPYIDDRNALSAIACVLRPAHETAVRLLYENLCIGAVRSHRKHRQVYRLLRTLQRNPRLGRLVKCLDLASWHPAIPQAPCVASNIPHTIPDCFRNLPFHDELPLCLTQGCRDAGLAVALCYMPNLCEIRFITLVYAPGPSGGLIETVFDISCTLTLRLVEAAAGQDITLQSGDCLLGKLARVHLADGMRGLSGYWSSSTLSHLLRLPSLTIIKAQGIRSLGFDFGWSCAPARSLITTVHLTGAYLDCRTIASAIISCSKLQELVVERSCVDCHEGPRGPALGSIQPVEAALNSHASSLRHLELNFSSCGHELTELNDSYLFQTFSHFNKLKTLRISTRVLYDGHDVETKDLTLREILPEQLTHLTLCRHRDDGDMNIIATIDQGFKGLAQLKGVELLGGVPIAQEILAAVDSRCETWSLVQTLGGYHQSLWDEMFGVAQNLVSCSRKKVCDIEWM